MFSHENFQTVTLNRHPRGRALGRILSAALNAVEPGAAVTNFLKGHPLPHTKRVFALGLGKAAMAMTRALTAMVTLTDALVITKHGSDSAPAGVAVMEGGHPVPNEASLAAGQAALRFVSRLTPDDLLICLISGGGSALMAAPIIPLVELQALTSTLLASGARIDEINTLRRHLDSLKGGGLARSANGAQIISLILSDVVGDSIEAIASGPTAPDPSTREDALALASRVAYSTYDFRETLKPNDPLFSNVHNYIIASNGLALRAAQKQAGQEGFDAQIIQSDLQGEARDVGRNLAEKLTSACNRYPRPFCLLAGGETTVTIRGNGKGGRNQELALGAVESLSGLKDVMLIAIATDGEDGPTDAAGAVVTGETLEQAGAPQIFLDQNDAYHYFEKAGDLLKPGPTGTNVGDLTFCFAL
jgi:hydroxypyruvate reductase